MKNALSLVLGLACACAVPAAESEAWDRLSRQLNYASADGRRGLHLEGLVSLTGYEGPQSIPGMVFTDSDTMLVPRLTLFADAQVGSSLSGFLQLRADRGFDPSDDTADVRLDEYAFRVALAQEGRCNLQVGKFATVVGNWVPRHDEWQNPFVGAPLPYEYVTGVYDREAPRNPSDLVIDGEEADYEYNPIIWGPVYATGAALSGRMGKFDFAAEIKNSGPSSRPEVWSLTRLGFEHPAYAVRLGFRPDLRFKFGLSASESTYLLSNAGPTLPPGARLSDYRERLIAQDFSFEWHHWQVWAEVFEASFAMPTLGVARSVAGYVEVRYKFTPEWSGALRWNRQVFSTLGEGAAAARWGTDLSRLDAAAVWRFAPQAQVKFQVTARTGAEGSHARLTTAVQLTVRF